MVGVGGVIDDPHHSDSPRSGAREILHMVTHPAINSVQEGLTWVNGREVLFPFGASRTQNSAVVTQIQP